MLDENIWMQLSEDEKFAELQTYLNTIVRIDEGLHELSHTPEQGKLAAMKKELLFDLLKMLALRPASSYQRITVKSF